jgi:hypothetical protein
MGRAFRPSSPHKSKGVKTFRVASLPRLDFIVMQAETGFEKIVRNLFCLNEQTEGAIILEP